jgi:glycine reductase
MLVARLRGEDYVSEYPMPVFDRVEPLAPLKDLAQATVALVTSGGIVPKGNPDKIESSSATRYARYDLSEVEELTDAAYQTAHGGYDPVYANNDPDRVLPVDVMRELEQQGVIGKLHHYYYVTVGNGTSVANARRYAAQIAAELKQDGVQAVILTST